MSSSQFGWAAFFLIHQENRPAFARRITLSLQRLARRGIKKLIRESAGYQSPSGNPEKIFPDLSDV